MEEYAPRLSLDRPANYQIKVLGHLDARSTEWTEGMSIAVDCDEVDVPVTTLTDCIDQAALQGLLRRLYSLGLPLISVICLDLS